MKAGFSRARAAASRCRAMTMVVLNDDLLAQRDKAEGDRDPGAIVARSLSLTAAIRGAPPQSFG